MTNKFQNNEKSSKKKHMKGINMFLKEEKKNGKKKIQERYQNFTEEEKEKKQQYHCECNKIFLRNKSRS